MGSVAAVFTVVAVGGLVLAIIRFGTRELPSKWLPLFHGGMALVGAALLALAARSQVPAGIPLMAMTVLVLAALGPFLLLLVYSLAAATTGLAAYGYHIRGESLPTPLLVIHASAAVCFLLTLAVWF